jgi:hypothetical protein
MTSQSIESFQSFELYQARQPAETQKVAQSGDTLFSKVVFAATVGVGFVACAASFLYPALMHMFYYEY